jgi:hypothetical protein
LACGGGGLSVYGRNIDSITILPVLVQDKMPSLQQKRKKDPFIISITVDKKVIVESVY